MRQRVCDCHTKFVNKSKVTLCCREEWYLCRVCTKNLREYPKVDLSLYLKRLKSLNGDSG